MIEAVILDFGGVVFRNKEEYEGVETVGMEAMFFSNHSGL
jgi:hypothetical protein